MTTIRTKIVLILLAMVLLPLIPLSLLVSNLVNQSYRVGVNPQVSAALEAGLAFSKQVYDLQRGRLTAALEVLAAKDGGMGRIEKIDAADLQLDSTYWLALGLQLFSSGGELLAEHSFVTDSLPVPDPLIFSQFDSPDRRQLVVSDRRHNLFTAVHRVFLRARPDGFLILQARLRAQTLADADRLLGVYQSYRALDLSRRSLPAGFLAAFISLALLLLLVVVAVGIWISARLTAPLSLLARGAEELGAGNLEYRLPGEDRRDEIGALVGTFNQMATRLKENQQRLIELEKRAAWQQMARKLAHEIKNPLTPIQLTTQQLLDQYPGGDPQYARLLQDCFSIISEEIGSLRRLVSEFSEFGRLPELHLQPENLNEIAAETADLLGERIRTELPADPPQVPVDHDRLKRVLINLLQNAMQADTSGAPVTLAVSYTETEARITVSDRGPGIPPENREQIFEPYFSTKKEGMGLGLAITRLIVEEHGGTIRAEENSGGGGRMVIRLPLTSAGREGSDSTQKQ